MQKKSGVWRLESGMIVLGIDPGTIKLGYGVVKIENNKFQVLASGTIASKSTVKMHKRLGKIFESIAAIITEYSPDVLALEKSFYHKNVRTTIALGEARGVILALAGKYDLELKEFSPMVVKQSVCGNGRADKERIQKMVKMLVSMPREFVDDNESDAIAIALCCLYRKNTCIATLKAI